MSQIFEDLLRSLCLRCSGVGLDCNYVVFGNNGEKVVDNAITHMFEYHAINPTEMTTCMKLKIRKNIHLYRDSV
jgi:predicted small metal-binding protein